VKKYLLLIVLILTACTPPPPPKTPLEIRELQTRSYDTKDVKLVMKSVMHSLQDEGFMIKQANVDLGLLTAQKEVDVGRNSLSPFPGRFGSDVRVANNAITEASANVSEFGQQTRVRINFQQKVLDNKGVTMKVRQIQNARFYQTFFSKVDKAVFLGKEKVQ
jgi:predicted small secreted protein